MNGGIISKYDFLAIMISSKFYCRFCRARLSRLAKCSSRRYSHTESTTKTDWREIYREKKKKTHGTTEEILAELVNLCCLHMFIVFDPVVCLVILKINFS